MSPLEVVGAFVATINGGDSRTLRGLMTPDHLFVDADGSEHRGCDQVPGAWAGLDSAGISLPATRRPIPLQRSLS